MRGLLGRLCGGSKTIEEHHSPLTGADRRPVILGPRASMEEASHVRFQDSDLDAIDTFSERNNNEKDVNDEEDEVIEGEDRVYSEVSEVVEQPKPAKRVHYKEDMEPQAMPVVRRRKRRERDSSRRERMEEKRERQTKEEGQVEEDGFDWLAGEHGEVKEMDVLRSMVQKLSLELGREQGRRRETGAQLEEAESPSWLTQLGGLVPLLVAYEEELRGVKNARDDLQQMVERDQVRLEELIEDNTEMATQLREIAMTGPLDPEEFHAMKESARLVLEENQLVREAEAEARHRLERIQVEARQRVDSAEEELASHRLENTRLTAANQRLQEEISVQKEEEQRAREERRKSVSSEVHTTAVKECQDAFEELKQNYKRETTEKDEQIESLQKKVSSLKASLDASASTNSQLDADLRLNTKMAQKFEELSLTLQVGDPSTLGSMSKCLLPHVTPRRR